MWNRKRLSPAALLLLLLIGFLSGALLLAFFPQPVYAITTFVSDNFENFTTGWTVGTGGSGTVTKSNTQVHGGSWAGKYFSIGSGDQAYTTRSWSPAPTADNHHSIWFYQMSTYTGASLFLLAEYGDGSKWCSISGITYHNSAWWYQNLNTSAVDVCTVTADTWHQMDIYYNYTSGKLHYYFDGVKQGGDWGSYSNSASIKPTICYFGDTSTTTTVGDGYCFLDDFSIDDAAEPSSRPVSVSGSQNTNSTLTLANWLFYSQWYLTTGTLSGYIFSYNASTSLVNETWVAFADTNNSWANVTKTLSNVVGTVIQWIVYANGSTGFWCVPFSNYTTCSAELTCYSNSGGSVRVNGTNVANGTAYTFNQLGSVANLGALSSNASYGFVNFTWNLGISGSSTTNSYNLTIYNCTTLWVYFYLNPESGSYIQACFNFTPSNPAINEPVAFNATYSISSAAILNYTWNFGDDNITSGAYSTINHTYTGNATFSVTLTIGGSLGNSSLTLALVVGWGANHTEPAYIFASFIWSPENPAIADWVTFDGSASQSSVNIDNYTWQFETGAEWTWGVSSTIQHQYSSNDTFQVSLIAGGDVGNSSTLTLSITVGWGANHTCVAAFTYSISRFEFSPSNPGNTTVIMFNGSQSYSTEAITDFSWNFGDGNVTSSGAQNWIEHTYGTDGAYDVTLTVSSTATNTSAMCFQELSVEAGGGGSVSRAGYAAYWLAGAIVVLLILIPTIVIVLRRRH